MEPWLLAGLAAGSALLAPKLHRRVQLSIAKHPSLAGHARVAKWLAARLPGYSYDAARFFVADDAPPNIAHLRQAGLQALADRLRAKAPRSIESTRAARDHLSDLQFTGAYRVPFQFSDHLREVLTTGSFVSSSSGVVVTDLDGNVRYDLTGSYGVNVFGVDFYKSCIEEATRRAAAAIPFPCVPRADIRPPSCEVVVTTKKKTTKAPAAPEAPPDPRALRGISGLDEVSFHMSGTEAVMQAVRLARYHTGRSHLVRFCGAYHGWWEDVQPGPGNPVQPHETYTLRDMDERTLQVLRTRNDIACVLVNPVQALHPNSPAPGDSTLVDSARSAGYDRAAYTRWLERLRAVCSERGIVLIFDEVFVGFRLARGGAQAYFGVPADLVTYGKTLGGGLPVGVLCGRAKLMRRYRQDRPADLCFARGTFNAHPYVMCAMQVFLERLMDPALDALYAAQDDLWNRRTAALNARLEAAGVPVRVANMASIWTVLYSEPSRYNWMLQFYLRDAGLALSWVGSGRIVFSLNYTDDDFEAVAERFVAAAVAMQQDGWWWRSDALTNQLIRRRILRESVDQLVPWRRG